MTLTVGFFNVGLGLGLIYSLTKCVSRFEELARLRLGLRGEQAVAEAVSELAEQGWRIFHDLPGGKDWNIDHVAVGPGGVFALETKTRSKRTAPPGVKDHEVIFDGKTLRFPWGEDIGAVTQATANARWLAEFLSKATGMPVEVFPVIVVPGWYVVGKGNFAVQAMNARYLTKYLGGLARKLSASDVQRIAHQVGQKCRDLEF